MTYEKKVLKNDCKFYPMKKTFFLGCDWLQLHCKHLPDFLTHLNAFYTFRLIGQSKVFKQIYEIRHISTNIVIGQYCTGAGSHIMPDSEGILKFENAQLYCFDNLKDYVVNVLDKLHLKFISITRFDICYDFQTFCGGLNPEKFIKQFVSDEILKVDNTVFGTYGAQEQDKKFFNQISFGSRRSNITYKLYNKTKELEVSGKNWIKAAHDVNFINKKLPVWRLEFSISSLSAFLRGEGKDFKFHSLECLDYLNMYGIFQGLFNKYFRFKKREKKRKTRMQEMKLLTFPLNHLELKIVKQNPMIRKSTRAEKIFVNKLNQFNQEYRLLDENFSDTAKDFISKIIDMHSLQDWADKKGIDYTPGVEYARDLKELADLTNKQPFEPDMSIYEGLSTKEILKLHTDQFAKWQDENKTDSEKKRSEKIKREFVQAISAKNQFEFISKTI
jgi:hypothetical protein